MFHGHITHTADGSRFSLFWAVNDDISFDDYFSCAGCSWGRGDGGPDDGTDCDAGHHPGPRRTVQLGQRDSLRAAQMQGRLLP